MASAIVAPSPLEAAFRAEGLDGLLAFGGDVAAVARLVDAEQGLVEQLEVPDVARVADEAPFRGPPSRSQPSNQSTGKPIRSNASSIASSSSSPVARHRLTAPGGRADALRQSIFDTSAKHFPSPYNLSSNSWNVSKHRGFSWTGRIVDRMERGRRVGGAAPSVRGSDVRQAEHPIEAPLSSSSMITFSTRTSSRGFLLGALDHRRGVEVWRGVRAVEAEFAVVGEK